MSEKIIALMLLFLTACAAAPQPTAEEKSECPLFEIPSESGCCRDLNENGICDVVDFAENISAEKQREYEQAAQKALETAQKSGRMKPTIMNELYENASKITNYRFLYKGDEVVVSNDSIVRKLVTHDDRGMQEINGRRTKVLVNEITLDPLHGEATARCIPDPLAIKEHLATPCDEILGMTFDFPYDRFSVKLPIEWLGEFLHRTPFEILPGTEIGKRKTTLYRFTALNDAQRKTSLWIDYQTSMPLRVEIRQGEELAWQEWYSDFYTI